MQWKLWLLPPAPNSASCPHPLPAALSAGPLRCKLHPFLVHAMELTSPDQPRGLSHRLLSGWVCLMVSRGVGRTENWVLSSLLLSYCWQNLGYLYALTPNRDRVGGNRNSSFKEGTQPARASRTVPLEGSEGSYFVEE